MKLALEVPSPRPTTEMATVHRTHRPAPAALIVAVLFVVMIGLSLWYLTRRVPLVIQGEVQSRTFDMAARVDGRIGQIHRRRARRTCHSGAPLIRIDNPELIAKKSARARLHLRVAEAELARVRAGFRAETIATRKAEVERAQRRPDAGPEDLSSGQGNWWPRAICRNRNLDKDRAALTLAERTLDQARFSLQRGGGGLHPRGPRTSRWPKVESAKADVETLQGAGRSDGSRCAGREPGVPHPGGGRRVRAAGRATDLADRPGRHVGAVRSFARTCCAILRQGSKFDVRVPALARSRRRARGPRDRRQGRIHRLAGDAGKRRLRPADVRDPRLSGAAGPRIAAGYERLYGLGRAAVVMPHAARTGGCRPAREVRWDPGRPRGAPSVVRRAGHRLCGSWGSPSVPPWCAGSDVVAVDMDNSAASRLFYGDGSPLLPGAHDRRAWQRSRRGGEAQSAPAVPSRRSICRPNSPRICSAAERPAAPSCSPIPSSSRRATMRARACATR